MAAILIIGASRGIGLETVRAALRAGHSVRALSRSAANIPIKDADLEKASGDARDRNTIRSALKDIDVVIQTLGVDFSPRLVFAGTTLFSESTRNPQRMNRFSHSIWLCRRLEGSVAVDRRGWEGVASGPGTSAK
jgi:hypothetical protein